MRKTKGEITLLVFLSIVIISLLAALIIAAMRPDKTEKFTEFYILNSEGRAEHYPEKIKLGEEITLLVSIVNREFEPVDYSIQVFFEGKRVQHIMNIRLNHGEKWQQPVSIKPIEAGLQEKVDFWLYKGTDSQPYRTLYLLVDVIQ